MMLRAEQIRLALEQKGPYEKSDPLVISPSPDLETLAKQGSASVDLRLGTWFVSLRESRMSCLEIDSRGKRPSHLSKTHYVPFGQSYYLHPGCFVLGITLEWLRLPNYLFGYVIGKSSLGRRGLVIATAIGVHPGFTGCLTLELSNVGEIPIAIKPGMLVCQLCFQEAGTAAMNIDTVDCSQFVGSRKPKLGRYELDKLAEKLADAAR